MQAADAGEPYNKTRHLQVKLDEVKKSHTAYFQMQAIILRLVPTWSQELKCKMVAAESTMHEDTIRFIHAAFEMECHYPVDSRLLTPRCVMFCMNELKKRPLSPRSEQLVTKFFEIKQPWQAEHAEREKALAQLREPSFSLTESELKEILEGVEKGY